MAYPRGIVKAKDIFLGIAVFLNNPAFYAWYVFSFIAVYLIFTYLSLDKTFSLDDHFFHIRFAELLWQKGTNAFIDFRSIYFSRMGIGQEYLVYYNFLFYLVLMPFALLNPLILGIKLYGIFAIASSFALVYIFLKKVSVRLPFLWTMLFLLVLLQSGWLARFTLARPFTLAPAFLVLMLYFLYSRRSLVLALIPFLYFFWHTATFIFPIGLSLGYFLLEQFYGKKPDWKLIGYPLMGSSAAIFLTYLLSPGVIMYLRDVIFPVFFDTAFTKTSKIAEGGEVYGKNFFAVITSFFWPVAALFIFGAYEVLRYIQAKKRLLHAEDEPNLSIQPLRLLLFMAAFAFLAATKLSTRFLDYFVYFCFLYVAISVTEASKFFEIRGRLFKKSFWIGSVIIGLYLFVSLSLNFRNTLAGSPSYLLAQAPAEWLNANAEKDRIIFNVDWDSFPTLYYFTGDKFRYVTGLEPRFLYDLEQKKYWIWNNIGGGIYCETNDCSEIMKQRPVESDLKEKKQLWYEQQGDLIADAILDNFETDILITSRGRRHLLVVMDNSSRFEKKFSGDNISTYAIYQILRRK